MKRLAIPFAAAALLAAATVAPAQNPGGGKGNSQDVSIKSSANPSLFRQAVTFDGKVKKAKDPVTVELQRRLSATGDWTAAGSMQSTATGEYAFIRRPRRNAYFRVVAKTTPEVVSDEINQLVRPRVKLRVSRTTLPAGNRVRFKGRVKPKHDGDKVVLQRKEGNVWAEVTKIRLREVDGRNVSKYRKRVRIPSTGTYRTVLPAHEDHTEGVSPERTINTTGS